MELINNLSTSSDSVAVAPAYIFESLIEVREERGLFYAFSLSTPNAHFEELNALAEASVNDDLIIKKTNVYIDVLNSYFRSSRSISSDIR
jgi:hypothetical protein